MIVAAAVKIPNEVYGGDLIISQPPPARHFTLLHPLFDFGIKPYSTDQGFLTSDGRFVDRVEAFVIAEQAGQLMWDPSVPGVLFSEDLW